MLVRVESADKIDNESLSVDCSEKEFRDIGTAVCHVDQTTGHEPWSMLQQVQEQYIFDMWHHRVRRQDRGTCASLISNTSDRGRGKNVEHSFF